MSPKITKEMTFNEILQMNPATAQVLETFNLGCVGCLGANTESLAQGARAHGLDIEELLAALNAISVD